MLIGKLLMNCWKFIKFMNISAIKILHCMVFTFWHICVILVHSPTKKLLILHMYNTNYQGCYYSIEFYVRTYVDFIQISRELHGQFIIITYIYGL